MPLYRIAQRIVKFVVDHPQRIVRNDFDDRPVFDAPFGPFADDSPVDIRRHIRMHVDLEQLVMLLPHIVGDLVLDLGVQQHRGGDFARSVAGRAFFVDDDLRFGPNPLPRNLHQTELRKRQDIVFGPVVLFQITKITFCCFC